MVLVGPAIAIAIKIAQKVFQHRQYIYRTLVAQDKALSSAYKYGGYGKATTYGVRSGALVGSIIGTVINEASDTPGNEFSVPWQKQRPETTPSKSYKARRRQSIRNKCRRYTNNYRYSSK